MFLSFITQRLQAHRISAVPILDDTGRLHGVFSISDLRQLLTHTRTAPGRVLYAPCSPFPLLCFSRACAADVYPALFQSVREYRTRCGSSSAPTNPVMGWIRKVFPPSWEGITVGTTLGFVITVLEQLHIHRVVVVDSHKAPLSIVSVGDVLSVLVVEPEGYFGTFFVDEGGE
jgi:CBS-domain-containing membrane protein